MPEQFHNVVNEIEQLHGSSAGHVQAFAMLRRWLDSREGDVTVHRLCQALALVSTQCKEHGVTVFTTSTLSVTSSLPLVNEGGYIAVKFHFIVTGSTWRVLSIDTFV